jgi:hypothetical protein
MDSVQFHNAAIEYVRQAAMASLAFESDGLTWEVAGEPLVKLLCRMVDEAERPFDFAVSGWSKSEEDDEATVSIYINIFNDDVDAEHSYNVEEKNLSDVLLQDFPGFEVEYFSNKIAAVERSCVVARAKLAARMSEKGEE